MTDTTTQNDTVPVKCTNVSCIHGRPKFEAPQHFNEEFPSSPLRGEDVPNGFISPCGNFFCSRECWVSYCDD